MNNALQKIRPTINTNRFTHLLLSLRSLPRRRAIPLVAALALAPLLLIGTLRFFVGGGSSEDPQVASTATQPTGEEGTVQPTSQATTSDASTPATTKKQPGSDTGGNPSQNSTQTIPTAPQPAKPQPQKPQAQVRLKPQPATTRPTAPAAGATANSESHASPANTKAVSLNAAEDPQPIEIPELEVVATSPAQTLTSSITSANNGDDQENQIAELETAPASPTTPSQTTDEEKGWTTAGGVILTPEQRKLRKFRRIEASIAKLPVDKAKARKYAAWLTHLGEYERGERFYLWYLKSHSDDAQAFYGLGHHYEQAEQWENACKAYYRTAQLNSKHEMARIRMARILAACPDPSVRDGAAAVAIAKEANSLVDWPKPEIADVLAAGLAETGDFDGAIRVQKWAIRSAALEDRTAMEERLELYRRKQPYRLQ